MFSDIGNPPGVENQNVVVVNAPCYFALAYAPAYKIYEHEPLPKTMRMLVPGCTGYDVERTDDRDAGDPGRKRSGRNVFVRRGGPDPFRLRFPVPPTWRLPNPNAKRATVTRSAGSR